MCEAIIKASVSHLLPVKLAAVTTVLGIVLMLGDAFFKSTMVNIMCGLTFASVLTLIAAPVFYLVFFGREARIEAKTT